VVEMQKSVYMIKSTVLLRMQPRNLLAKLLIQDDQNPRLDQLFFRPPVMTTNDLKQMRQKVPGPFRMQLSNSKWKWQTWLSNKILATRSLMYSGSRGCSTKITFLALGSVINELGSYSTPSEEEDKYALTCEKQIAGIFAVVSLASCPPPLVLVHS